MPTIPPPPPSLAAIGGTGPVHDLGTTGMVVLVLGTSFTVVMIVIALAIVVRTELDNRQGSRP
jgi:hypothetical protein